MSTEVKQEGDFKLKAKKAPMKKLNKPTEVTKVDLTKHVNTEEPTKVVIPSTPIEPLPVTKVEVIADVPENKEVVNTVIEEMSIEEIKEDNKPVAATQEVEYKSPERQLPENIEKLVSFMEETGGDITDFVRLNADYSNVNGEALLKEYYKKTRPHLDNEEIEFLMEDKFEFDEDLDEERDIKKKKLAFKEEVAKAKGYLEEVKSKYYSEIKLRPGVTQDQQKASDFFNRYNEEQQGVEKKHSKFKNDTRSLFTNEFKGFEFNVGEKSFRYNVPNSDTVAEKQSNISNLIGKFLNEDGEVKDLKGYHKAIYAADNADTIAKHFYEQGKSDGIKEIVAKSNNVSTEARKTAGGELFINGLKVKAISGVDSSKLTIKKRF
mgnify:FL=1